jgi:hypothetical protein
VDLLYLKSYVIGHPFQPAWFHLYPLLISRETLFHYNCLASSPVAPAFFRGGTPFHLDPDGCWSYRSRS